MTDELDYEQTFLITRKAKDISDGATVSKRTGTYSYTLRQGLTVYTDQKGEKPMKIDGIFLVNDRAQINQISPDTLLTEEFSVDELIDLAYHLEALRDHEDK